VSVGLGPALDQDQSSESPASPASAPATLTAERSPESSSAAEGAAEPAARATEPLADFEAAQSPAPWLADPWTDLAAEPADESAAADGDFSASLADMMDPADALAGAAPRVDPADLLAVLDPPPPVLPEATIPADELVTGPASQVVHTNYQKAMKEAAEDRKMLFIYFHDHRHTAARRAFERETLANVEIQEKLKRYVMVRLPRDARIVVDGNSVALLEHASFAEMLNRSGVAVIDFTRPGSDYYGHVVSTFPFTPGKYMSKEALSIVLDLPPGTLTQRTMIYAVRIHPEAPKSTQGQFHNVLAHEANQHASHQAAILLQGHHSWDTRFHRINSQLPGGVLAQEVVAESWPNENLVEACIECVHSWRQSPGHWGAVRSRHPLFGYDIKRGRNGIWYATGIFGRR
jgi:hypothetical protein